MNSKIKLLIVVIVAALVIFGGTYWYNKISNLNLLINNLETNNKKQIPEVILYDEQDAEISTLSFKGKPTVINFWTTWCQYCVMEMPNFEKAYNKYKDQVNFVLIDSLDNEEETKENGIQFKNEHNMTMPIYFDREHKAISKFGAPGFPTTYFVDKNGYIYKINASMIKEEKLFEYIEKIINIEEE